MIKPEQFIAKLTAVIGILFLPASALPAKHLRYGWQDVGGIHLFYREGGRADAPTILFPHGNPASSIQYEEVMENLLDARDVHVIAVDYPSFGYSAVPDRDKYGYTFPQLARTVQAFLRAKGIARYALFMQDYGVPVGFHLTELEPQAVSAIMVQNGVIHLDGFPLAQDPNGQLRRHWASRNPQIDARRNAYIAAMSFPSPDRWEYAPTMSPEAILLMMASAQRPGVAAARADLWFDYGNNVRRYPVWQKLLRRLNVPVLVIWGSRDDFFTTPGACAYLQDVPGAEVHILEADHFATLEQPDLVSPIIASFVGRNLHSKDHARSDGPRGKLTSCDRIRNTPRGGTAPLTGEAER